MKKESNQKIMDTVLKWIGVFMLLKDFIEQIVEYIGYLMNILALPTTNHSRVQRSGFTF
ncbi:MAG: hypothetical protein JEZ08_12680 [Clostridiales bacterium]|nr:hypothetical protein [Clostridiales bacterium]